MKAGKDASAGESYMPVSLLSPVANTLGEAIHQHEFRHNIVQQHSMPYPHKSVEDKTRTFDRVKHATLFEDVDITTLLYMECRNKKSKPCGGKQSVLQG